MIEKNSSRKWSTLIAILKPQRWRLIFAIMCTAFAAFMELLPYWILFEAISALINNQLNVADEIVHLAILMVIAILMKTIAYGLGYYFSHRAAFLILLSTRYTLLENLSYLPISITKQYHSGELKQFVVQDVERIENFVAHHSVEVSSAIFVPLFVSIYLFWLDWRLALAAVICAPLAMFSSLIFLKNMASIYDDYRQAATTMNSTIIEYLRNIQVIKLFRQSPKIFSRLEQGIENYYQLINKMTKASIGSWAFFTSLLSASLLFILPLGLHLYTTQQISLMTLIIAVVLGASLLRPLLKISKFFNEIKDVMSGVKRIEPILMVNTAQYKSDESPKNSMALIKAIPTEVIFENISFDYDGKPLLTNVNLTLQQGTTSYIVGESGVGKSTLIQLLSGLLSPSSGKIWVNSIHLAQLTECEKSQLIATASQDVFLFKGTIKENIQFAKTDVSDVQLNKAINAAQLQNLIARLPCGLDTLVSESANNLSGGEKQRIALARALLVETPILILDEATSFADNITQAAIYRNIRLTYPNCCVLIISHTIPGIEYADQIIVLNEEGIEEIGSPTYMLEKNRTCLHFLAMQKAIDNWAISTPSLVNLNTRGCDE